MELKPDLRALALALCLVMPLAAACGSDSGSANDDTSQSQSDQNNNNDNDGDTDTDTDINVDVDGTDMVDGWPDSVPQPDGGTLTASMSQGADSYWGSWLIDGEVKAVFEDYRGAVEGSGFTKTSEFNADGSYTATFESNNLVVTIIAAEENGQVSLWVATAPL